MSWRD